MSIDWTPLADLIETHDRFLVTTHVRPDGDALGSEVGMAGLAPAEGEGRPGRQRQPDAAPLRFSRPRRDAVRALRDAGRAGRPGRPRGAGDPRPVGLEPARRHGRVGPRVRRAAGGDRPPRQPGRPGRDLPQGHRRPRRPARWSSARSGPWGDVHARDGDRPADGDRDGHRLVPPPEHRARDLADGGRAWSRRGADRRRSTGSSSSGTPWAGSD